MIVPSDGVTQEHSFCKVDCLKGIARKYHVFPRNWGVCHSHPLVTWFAPASAICRFNTDERRRQADRTKKERFKMPGTSIHELAIAEIDRLSRKGYQRLALPEPLESGFEQSTFVQRAAR